MHPTETEVTAQTSPDTARPVVLQADEGRLVHAFGDSILFKLTGAETAGTLAVGLDTTPPGGGPPLHYHRNEDELFLVIDGTVSYCVEGTWTDLGPGGLAYVPRGVVHTFQNRTDAPVRHWILTTPHGFERYFERCAAVFATPGAPDMAQIMAISDEHGIVFPPPPEATEVAGGI